MSNNLYHEEILDHFKNPRNFGQFSQADRKGRAVNTFCGDEIEIELILSDDRSRVKDVRFKGRGCAISMASASMLTEEIKGKTVEELKEWNRDRVSDTLKIELSPTRLKCALLPLEALHQAIYDNS